MIRMFADYARYYLGRRDEGQGTLEYTILSGVAVIGLVVAFDIADIGTVLANWLKTAIAAV